MTQEAFVAAANLPVALGVATDGATSTSADATPKHAVLSLEPGISSPGVERAAVDESGLRAAVGDVAEHRRVDGPRETEATLRLAAVESPARCSAFPSTVTVGEEVATDAGNSSNAPVRSNGTLVFYNRHRVVASDRDDRRRPNSRKREPTTRTHDTAHRRNRAD